MLSKLSGVIFAASLAALPASNYSDALNSIPSYIIERDR